MSQRWDVQLTVLSGSLQGSQQVLKGPVVRIGTNPGAGGLRLTGYRGVDGRHATITAYDASTAAVAPVGTNQVRTAPHAQVDWSAIEPMSGAQYLNVGAAIHIGPPGRGAVLQFDGCQELGAWEGGNLAGSNAGPSATIVTSTAPVWFVGCLLMMGVGTIAIIGALVLVWTPPVERPEPVREGEQMYAFVEPDFEYDERLADGIEQGFADFVMTPNAALADDPSIEKRENWDEVFLDKTTASLTLHAESWSFYKRLEAVHEAYALVVGELREAEMPEVFAAIPYQESQYRPKVQSHACAKGYWQFMPEVAHRVSSDSDLGFRVVDCKIDGVEAPWTPAEKTPPKLSQRVYVNNDKCRIKSCRIDDRTDLELSTGAAIYALREVLEDADIAESGAAVQMAILSHNAGYNDARFGVNRSINVLPAYKNWRKEAESHALFYGSQIRCETPTQAMGRERCGARLSAEAQHYAYTIVAQHLLAVCYYAENHGDDKTFRPWVAYTQGGGYCQNIAVPTREAVANH